MKLSLIFPAYNTAFGIYKKVAKGVTPYPPLNLILIAAYAEKLGWEVQFIDGHAEQLEATEILGRISRFQPDLIGLTATTPFFPAVYRLSEMFKEKLNTPIMVGGPHISIMRENAMMDCFDYIFIGECELSISPFLKNFAKGSRLVTTRGVMMRHEGKLIYHGDAPRLDDLDSAPLAARHLLKNELYVMGTLQGKKITASMQMSRGCPYECVFCASDLYGRKVRRRNLENIMSELDTIVNGSNIKHIVFLDDTLTLNRKFIMAFCDEIEKRNLKFTFEGGTRANLWDEPMVRRLQECGLIRISFGLESADPQVREIIKKKVPLESYDEANKLNNRLGIETINSAMMGLPGDTRESVKKTIKFVANSKNIHHITYNIAIPYPGTEMRRMALEGEHGLKLMETDFGKYHRYGSAIMEVNDLKREDLVELQKEALWEIYFKWWRIIPMLKRHGITALITPGLSTLKLIISKYFRKFK